MGGQMADQKHGRNPVRSDAGRRFPCLFVRQRAEIQPIACQKSTTPTRYRPARLPCFHPANCPTSHFSHRFFLSSYGVRSSGAIKPTQHVLNFLGYNPGNKFASTRRTVCGAVIVRYCALFASDLHLLIWRVYICKAYALFSVLALHL